MNWKKNKYYIEKFIPAYFNLNKDGIKLLDQHISKNWQYATNGRASIYHILKAYDIKSIMLPTYICHTVLEPIKKLNIKVKFYDLDVEDLNPSIESLKKLYSKDVDAVLVASMYGNPANLDAFEKFCNEKNILLIDDAAQSFGAILNGRYIGTFGNAGFFSMSPGKPLAGHLGSFFWVNTEYKFNYKNNIFYHYFKWKYFQYTRRNVYKNNYYLILLFEIINKFVEKLFYSYYDNITELDKEIIGGIFYSYFNNKWEFRKKITNQFKKLNLDTIRLITNKRGISNNHKLVFLVKNKKIADQMKLFLKRNKIYFINGYKPLYISENLPNSTSIIGLVFEIPIEDNEVKMKQLYKIIEDCLND
jgi:dTDP-4-amino-4,6-dideoxygalactose transaminase